MIILIDRGHGIDTLGKRSPDESLIEWKYCDEIAKRVKDELISKGYDCRLVVDVPDDIPLGTRCKIVNDIVKDNKDCLLVSIHNDAHGLGDKWTIANGWSCFVYREAGEDSKKLAGFLYDEAKNKGYKMRIQYQGVKYWTAGYYILKHTKCPAVLTENLFQTNHADVDYLLSDRGKQDIVDVHINGIINYINSKK